MRICNSINVWKHPPQVVSIQNDFQEILVWSCATKCVIRMMSVFLTRRRANIQQGSVRKYGNETRNFCASWQFSFGWRFPPTHQKWTNEHEPFFCKELSLCSRPAARWGVLKKSYGSYKEGKNLQTLIIILLHRKVWASHTTPPPFPVRFRVTQEQEIVLAGIR